MPTVGWTEKCPKCGETAFEVESRYGDRRAECSTCGYFYEDGWVRTEGFIRKPREGSGQYHMVNDWFSLPSHFRGDVRVEYTYDSRISKPERLLPKNPLHLAAKQGDLETLQQALSVNSGLVNSPEDEFGMALLHAAAFGGCVESGALLLTYGANVNAPDWFGETPLHSASWVGAIDMATLLVEHGADINARDQHGSTPLHVAAITAHEEMVAFLLASGADLHARDHQGSAMEVIRALPQNERDDADHILDALLCHGEYLVHFTAKNGLEEDLRKALSMEPDKVNAPDPDGWVPIHWALYRAGAEKLGKIRLLLGHGADIHVAALDGTSPLHLAAGRYGPTDPEAVSLFLVSGVGPDIRDAWGRTALHWVAGDASSQGVRAMRVLLEAGADINAVDCTGSTPLHQTAIATDTTSARFLLEHQANPNVRDQNGCTPLHLACWYRYFDRRAADTALLLLAHGADANVRENQGETSLHKAVEENMPKYAKVLLRHGADPTLADDRGRTARSIAEEKGHLEIVDILDRYDRGEPLEQPALSMDRFEEDIDLDLEIDLDGPNSPSQTILRRNDLDLYRCRASAGRTADDDGHFQPKPLLDLEIECTDSPPHYPLAPPTQPEPDPRGAETPVGDAGFSVRTSNYLQYIGIKTIGDIANCTESELLAFRHFGKKSLMEVKAKLALYNLSLKAEG